MTTDYLDCSITVEYTCTLLDCSIRMYVCMTAPLEQIDLRQARQLLYSYIHCWGSLGIALTFSPVILTAEKFVS